MSGVWGWYTVLGWNIDIWGVRGDDGDRIGNGRVGSRLGLWDEVFGLEGW